ncbi:MAG: Eco57I restriction-modification methylase domain-containing protein, partial [Bacteroidaceae bacterium]|nr:Eco57I restriction-modification methylase domain-containing protein [Bacteroidaceae bacterium]
MNYKEVIESRYNRQKWQELLHDIFGSKVKFWGTPSEVPTSSQFAKRALWLGTITLSDEQTISIYEVELTDSVDIERNRRGIRDMLLTQWRNNGNAGAFMFCYRKNESVLRFSYVSESWNFAEDGSYKKESTDTRRFTYLLGEGHRSRTAIQQFEKLKGSALSLKDLTKAFSVDAVGDMFFNEYKKNYEDIIQFITGKRMVKISNKWEEKVMHAPCKEIMQEFSRFPKPEKAVRDYVKKLMGRLVFLQFLQKKGWLGVPVGKPWGYGDHEFIQNLFVHTKDKDHFVDNVLEALFHDLNSENEKKLPQYYTPYLNGGLFEREATDETEFPLPGKYMQQMLDFFSSYNFTIDENDPDDAEVGVDPEMLGRIFENLLEDKKDKGAFYTPKEIVQYMCRESLIAYLQTDVDDKPTKEAIRQFVLTHDTATLGNIAEDIDQRLKDVKICDPAIGSGAFPMGLLKELFLCRTAIEGIEQSKAAEIKKHIIQQNIYGVDIEHGAVDIARLRFWLSLIVDEEMPQALPNLDFKIMQGNSLLEQYKGVDLSTMTEKKVIGGGFDLFDDMLDVYRKQLRDKLVIYYNCTDRRQKKQLRQEITDNVKQQLQEQGITLDFGNIDLSGTDQFMLWHTWFYDVFAKGGFDIVIGNPPYIQLQNNSGELAKLYEQCNYSTFARTGDIYCLFYERGWQLLRENGCLCYITSNKWMRAGYGEKTRGFFASRTNPMQLIDFAGVSIFENATVDTNILLFSKSNNQHETICAVTNKQNKDSVKNLSDFVQQQNSIC